MKRFSIRPLLLIIIGILNILIAAPLGYMAYKSFQNHANAQEIREVSGILYYLYNTKKYLSLERAAAMSILFVPTESFESLNSQIKRNRALGDETLQKGINRVGDTQEKEVFFALSSIRDSYNRLKPLRLRLDAAALAAERGQDVLLTQEYFNHITALIHNIDNLINVYSAAVVSFSPEINRQVRQSRLMWDVSEYAGQEYALLGQLIARNRFPDPEMRERLLSLRGRIQYGLDLAQDSVEHSRWRENLKPSLEEAQTHYFMIFEQIKDIFYRPATAPIATLYPITVEMWLQLASEAVNSLYDLTDAVLDVNALYVAEEERNAIHSIYISLFLFSCAVALSIYFSWLINSRVIYPVNSMVEALYRETELPAHYLDQSHEPDEIAKLRKILEVFRENSHQLEKERDRAEAANVAKSEFLANMSHEIRTPMNVVVNLASILSRTAPLSEKQAQYIKTLQVSAETLLSLINDLLDFSKIDAKSLKLESAAFNLKQIVDELALLNRFRAEDKGLKFEVLISGIEGKEYSGDPTRIRQILSNLCNNALKFTEKGTVTLKVVSSPHAQNDFENILITVSDTGIGIPKDKLDIIFEKFTQADATVVRKYGGTGLGLAITKSLVEMMGGTIDVDSTMGEGSTFFVTLPLYLKAQQSLFFLNEKDKDIPEKNDASPRRKGKVLLVEDYQPNAVVASIMLEEFGYDYDIAESGQEAVQKYIEDTYNAVLMDVQMPGMDGYQATQTIRAYEKKRGGPRVKIIGLTAHVSDKDRQKCLEAGMDDYLSKPFKQRQLFDKLSA